MNKVELFLQKEIQKPKNWLIKEFYERKNFSNEELLYLFPNNKLKRNGLPMKKGGSKKKREKRKIIRSQHLFNVIEDVIDEIICSKWQDNSFFGEFVEFKNVNIGDKNEFYVSNYVDKYVDKYLEGDEDE